MERFSGLPVNAVLSWRVSESAVRVELTRPGRRSQSLPQSHLARVGSISHEHATLAQILQLPAGCNHKVSRSVLSDSWQPMDCSTPGLPVHHQLMEFTQTHVHRVGDAIQPSHPLASPSPPAPNPSQHQSFSTSQLFASGGQSTGVSALASVPPKNTQG